MRAPREVPGHRFAKRETARDTHAPRDSAHGHDGLAPAVLSFRVVHRSSSPLTSTRRGAALVLMRAFAIRCNAS